MICIFDITKKGRPNFNLSDQVNSWKLISPQLMKKIEHFIFHTTIQMGNWTVLKGGYCRYCCLNGKWKLLKCGTECL